MGIKIYVLTRRGEPVYATTDLQKIKDDCQKWFDDNYDNFWVHQYFDWWVEGRNYPNTDDGEDAAWRDYVEAQFENGTWEHYAWYECYLK